MLPRGNIFGDTTMTIRGPPDKEKAHCWTAGGRQAVILV